MKPRFIVRIPILLLAGALALAAGGANAASSNACKLIPAAAAAKILGTTGVETQLKANDNEPFPLSACHYFTGSANHAFSRKNLFMIGLSLRKYTDLKQTVAQVKDFWSRLGVKATFKDVSGLGDAAFLALKPTLTTLYVFSGGSFFFITTIRPPTPANVALVEKLAGVALTNLK